ncbi:MAG: Acyl-CoA:1-acyl-sn-glycerol-3-phosphate acyltransferase, partial [uncultured Thermomicrobiales bacterium]
LHPGRESPPQHRPDRRRGLVPSAGPLHGQARTLRDSRGRAGDPSGGRVPRGSRQDGPLGAATGRGDPGPGSWPGDVPGRNAEPDRCPGAGDAGRGDARVALRRADRAGGCHGVRHAAAQWAWPRM